VGRTMVMRPTLPHQANYRQEKYFPDAVDTALPHSVICSHRTALQRGKEMNMQAATTSCNDWGFGSPDLIDDLAAEVINLRADNYAFAWLKGKWDAHIEGDDGLASIVSEQLCDSPGNEFRAVLEVVRRAARGGDIEAGKLIERLAHDHATAAYERGALL
jgi:hypothetical protein